MKSYFTCFVIILLAFSLFAQEKEKHNPKDSFLEAESYLLYEEYTEALPLYLKLSKGDPTNDNLNYKVGLCYLSVPYEKEKAIIYLEKASKNISKEYRPNNFKETQAPLDALFYLGNAYRINNQLDKALDAYSRFKKQIDPEIYDETLVDEQIATLERARRYISKPVKFSPVNLGDVINSKFSETNAVVSADERTLIYNVKLQFYDAMFFSTRDDNTWSAPINIIPDLGVDGDVYATSLSADGKELFIYRSDNYDGNIYVSRYINDRWTPIKRLNENINTKYWESHASVSNDGKTLYFTSNKRGGYGCLDIFTSTRDDVNSDNWKLAQNMGSQINTSYNEETPFVTDDGSTLFYSSYGHFNMGGYDVFYSNLLENGKWSAPLNMGYPINTTDDDIFFVPVKNGTFAYMCRYYPDGFGKTDIFKAEIYTDQHPRKFILKGLVGLPSDFDNSEGKVTAYVINKTTRDTILTFAIDPRKPKFDSKLVAGNYQLVIQGNNIEKSVQDFAIDKNQASDEFALNANLRAKKVEEIKPVQPVSQTIEELAFVKNFYKVTSANKIEILLDLPIGSKVNIAISVDSVNKKNIDFAINKAKYKYIYEPVPGRNILKFSAITPNNIRKEGVVLIVYEQIDTLIDTTPIIASYTSQEQFNYAKNMITAKASKNLAKRINNTTIDDENINIDEFGQLIKQYAKSDSFSANEIDSIIALFKIQQPLAASLLLNALKEISSPKLSSFLDSIAASRQYKDVFDLIDAFLTNKEITDNRLELLYATSQLADRGSVFYYLEALRKCSSGNLKTFVDSLDLVDQNIHSPEDLLNYLYSNSEKGGYSKDDIYDAYFALPLFTDSPKTLHSVMIGLAAEPMSSFVSGIHINEKQIVSISDLADILRKNAEKEKISEKSILELLIASNSAHYYNQLKEDLNTFALGKVKELFSAFAIEEKQTNSASELVNWILKHSDDDALKNDLIKTFSQIASKNLLLSNEFKAKQESSAISTLNISVIAIFSVLLLFIIIIAIKRKRDNEDA